MAPLGTRTDIDLGNGGAGRAALRMRRRPDEPTRIEGNTATVYSSAPAARRVRRGGARRGGRGAARARGRGRARGRPADPAASSCRPPSDAPDHPWDPALVSTNAHRAADDPSAIAYLGELDYGASAVSLPITNDAGLLQVSPGDGLTSLTRRPPGRPRAGPERYYPSDERSFVRVGPSDLEEAEWLVERVRASWRAPPGHGLRPRDLRPRAGRADRGARAPRRDRAGRLGGVPRRTGRDPRASRASLPTRARTR